MREIQAGYWVVLISKLYMHIVLRLQQIYYVRNIWTTPTLFLARGPIRPYQGGCEIKYFGVLRYPADKCYSLIVLGPEISSFLLFPETASENQMKLDRKQAYVRRKKKLPRPAAAVGKLIWEFLFYTINSLFFLFPTGAMCIVTRLV